MLESLILAVLIVAAGVLFFLPVQRRIKIIRSTKGTLSTENAGRRVQRWIGEVLFQTKVIGQRPLAGFMHALVFWGFLAFMLATTDHFCRGFGFSILGNGGFFHLYSKVVSVFAVLVIVGITYLFIPFMVTAIYLSLLNFDFELLEVAKINGAKPWRAFVEITWPLNWMGTVIGLVLVFVPSMAESITSRFLGGPNAASFGQVLSLQFGETGTWALGSAMGVVLFAVSSAVIFAMWLTVNLQRSGFTGREG